MLLINENLAVSRIINLIAHKENLEVEEFENIDSVIKNQYEFILIDNDSYKDGMLSELKGRFKYKKLIFIAPKNGGKPLGFDDILFKPFLPIDFLKVVEKSVRAKPKIEKKVEEKKIKSTKEPKIVENDLKIESYESDVPEIPENLTPKIEKIKKEEVKEKVESIAKKSVESIFSSSELKELLRDIEININISFKVKDRK